ncbi:hypothetical protein J6590_038297 [Homalodisca vitripennis]|nr:hypothetical protein J6590_038297 [Homalodisca vitripennis]
MECNKFCKSTTGAINADNKSGSHLVRNVRGKRVPTNPESCDIAFVNAVPLWWLFLNKKPIDFFVGLQGQGRIFPVALTLRCEEVFSVWKLFAAFVPMGCDFGSALPYAPSLSSLQAVRVVGRVFAQSLFFDCVKEQWSARWNSGTQSNFVWVLGRMQWKLIKCFKKRLRRYAF